MQLRAQASQRELNGTIGLHPPWGPNTVQPPRGPYYMLYPPAPTKAVAMTSIMACCFLSSHTSQGFVGLTTAPA
eukprot:scaffold66163_cov39-Prasinocladus_malaysianus.AAC.2